MIPEEEEHQEKIHQALVDALDLDGDELLTGWVVVYETASAGENASAGHYYGPSGMTTWRAMGLLEWASRITLHPNTESDE